MPRSQLATTLPPGALAALQEELLRRHADASALAEPMAVLEAQRPEQAGEADWPVKPAPCVSLPRPSACGPCRLMAGLQACLILASQWLVSCGARLPPWLLACGVACLGVSLQAAYCRRWPGTWAVQGAFAMQLVVAAGERGA